MDKIIKIWDKLVSYAGNCLFIMKYNIWFKNNKNLKTPDVHKKIGGLCLFISVIILIIISYFVFKDAKSRGMNAMFWSGFTFFILIIALPLYFIMRKPKLQDKSNVNNFENLDELHTEQRIN